MNKNVKKILIVVGIVLIVLIIDSLQALIFNNSPIIKFRDELKDGYVDKGVLVNYYNCGIEKASFKWSDLTCKKPELVIYDDGNGRPIDPDLVNSKERKVLKKVETDTYDAEILSISKNYKYLLIKDDVLKILNLDNEEFNKVDLESDYEKYILVTSGEKIVGIIYFKNKDEFYSENSSGFYSLKSKNKLYDGMFSVILFNENDGVLNAQKSGEAKWYVLSVDEEKVIQ